MRLWRRLGQSENMPIRIEEIGDGMPPTSQLERAHEACASERCPLDDGLSVWNDEVELGPRYSVCLRRVGEAGAEEGCDAALRHQAENGIARQRELGHARHVEPGGRSEYGLIERGATPLIMDVKNKVSGHVGTDVDAGKAT